MSEVYIVYGLDVDMMDCEQDPTIPGGPTFMEVFASREDAMKYFREKVMTIARGREYSNKYFEDLKDDELFVSTPVLLSQKYEEDDEFEEQYDKQKVFIFYCEDDDEAKWAFFDDGTAYDWGDAKLPRVQMKKLQVHSKEDVE